MKSVYKYRANLISKDKKTGEEFRQDTRSLLNSELYAAKFKMLNDPFEGAVELPKSDEHSSWVTPLKQDMYKSGIYSLAVPKKGEDFPNNELMWAHYANSHSGFCIEYNLNVLQEETKAKGFDLRNIIEIKYDNDRPEIIQEENIVMVQKKAWGTKSLVWNYENEIRLVFETDGVKSIKQGAIKSIYFGLNIGYDERRAIIDILKAKDVKFYQIEIIDNLYKLKAVEIDFNLDYEIVGTRHNNIVKNYTILYESNNKDENSLIDFIKMLRSKYPSSANFTVIDDLRAYSILDNYKPRASMTKEAIEIMSKHWIALSTFDAPDFVFMYPEK